MSQDRICGRGHEVTGHNRIEKRNGYTVCRECQTLARMIKRERVPRPNVLVQSQENARLK